jgi:hypothetical protein
MRLDFLGAGLGRNQHGIRGLDNHHVFAADAGDEAVFGDDQVAVRIFQPDVALHGIVVGIPVDGLPQRIPGTDVGPADVERHDATRDVPFLVAAGSFSITA